MDFSIATLLANFSGEKTLTLKTLEKRLNCKSDASQRDLQIAVDALERIGILEKDRGKYRRVEADDVIEGRLRCSSKGFCFAIQDQEGAEDIYVRESQLNHAWNGDRVLVRVTKEGNRRRSPEGEVKLILERANASVLARVKQEDGSFRAVPLDDRLLFELELLANGADPKDAVDQLAHVEILRYPLGQAPPQGKVAQVLGSDAEAASDLDIVYCKHDLPKAFSEAVLADAQNLPTRVLKADLKGRLDLRDALMVTIDGSKSQIIDDALSLEKTEDGHWQLGVHISDIAYYVESQSNIDHEAFNRGASVYLGEEVVPMLPPQLTQGLGSLTVGKDRLAISVLVSFDEAGDILEYQLQPSVVKVDQAVNYRQAQAVLQRDDKAVAKQLGVKSRELKALEPIYTLLENLYHLSQVVRQKRLERGSFELKLPESDFPVEEKELVQNRSPKFQYDDEGLLGVMVVASSLPARNIVTEFMLLANQLVAQHLQALQVPALFRVHRTPDVADVQELIKLAANLDIQLTLQDEDAVHSQDYQRFVEQFAASNSEKVLTYLLLETFKPPFYSAHPDIHFGLALANGYTHFASPTRRYSDLVTHRILRAVFEQGRDRRSTRSKDRVNLRHSSCHGEINWNVLPPDTQHDLEDFVGRVAIPLTERERRAQDAETDIEGLKKAEFMRSHMGEVFHGLITGVQSYGFFVEIEELLVEGLVHVSSLKDDWYEYRSRQQTLVGRKNRKQYR
ncbi:iron ABC transporter substrate-binding protein, partial [filamentous cyanobacterium CCP5]